MKRIVCLFFILTAVVLPAAGLVPQVRATAAEAPKVEIFVTSWCPYCRHLEDFLKKKDIAYTRYDVEADAKGAEIFDAIGGAGVPVTRVGKEVIHGFDPDRILAAFQARN